MGSKRGIFLLCLPLVAGAALLGTAVWLRPSRESGEISVRKKDARPGAPGNVASYPARPPVPAPPDRIAGAMEEARVRATYRNYRAAVATGNTVLQEALKTALLHDGDAALRFAREDLSRAANGADREVAQKTIDSLGRQP